MIQNRSRREFLRDLGLGAAALPFVLNLPSLGFANQTAAQAAAGRHVQPQRRRAADVLARRGRAKLHAQGEPQAAGAVQGPHADPARRLRQGARRRRQPHARHRLPAHRHRAVSRQHPGRLATRPAGWASGISIDQEIKNYLQSDPATRTRFGSLEFGVMVPDRADTWTRMVYAGAEQADRADRRSVPDVRQALRPGEGSGEPQERARRRAGRFAARSARPSAPRTGGCWTSTPPSSARWSRS